MGPSSWRLFARRLPRAPEPRCYLDTARPLSPRGAAFVVIDASFGGSQATTDVLPHRDLRARRRSDFQQKRPQISRRVDTPLPVKLSLQNRVGSRLYSGTLRLVTRKQLTAAMSATRLFFEIHVSKGLPVQIFHDKTGVQFLDELSELGGSIRSPTGDVNSSLNASRAHAVAI